ncbi:MAG: STAS domain-containing protein [Planctomycetes bacterium]|nr:STAS domain-containing protein [Planctomycetota bacterium]
MDINIQKQDDGVSVIAMSGELGSHSEDAIRDQLHPIVGERSAKVIVDMTHVKTIDSSGLSHLIGLVTHARMANSRVVLSGPSSFVRGVLEVTQLDRWFELADSVEQAGKLFAEPLQTR